MRHYITVLMLFSLLSGNTLFAKTPNPLTTTNVLAATTDADWRTPAQEDLLYLQFDDKQVIFELATDFAPQHIKNLRELTSIDYFDGLSIIRSQDNYVVQWGDPNAGTDESKSTGKVTIKLAPEFFQDRKDLSVNFIKSQDAYANHVGFSNGFAVAANSEQVWLTHCYGALGVGRGVEANSGNATELYVVTGHAPRHLDKNVTLIGRVLSGMQHLSSLPRGEGELGFYTSPEKHITINKLRLGSQIPRNQQMQLQVLRTDTQTFDNYVRARTYRAHEWFLDPTGKIELCNVGVPVRKKT